MYKCLVLLATYNGAKYIKEQISSILNQTNIEVTLLISDDSSTDATLEVIESFDNYEIKLLKNVKYRSPSQNFFRLIRECDEDFDFFALADQDDIWNSNKLYRAIEVLNNKDVQVCSSDVLAFWEDEKEIVVKKSYSQKKKDYFFESGGAGCTYVFEKDFFIELKKWIKKENLLDIENYDWLIYAYARSHGRLWFIDDEVSVRYRQHENNAFGANVGFKKVKQRWIEARSGWYRNQIINIAKHCGYDHKKEIQYLIRNTYWDRLRLSLKVLSFRRKFKESIFLFFILVIPGFK